MNFDGFQKALAEFQGRCSTLLGSLTRLQPNRARPPWARIAQPWGGRPMAMTVEAIEERLEGIPVYALSNASEEFLLVSGSSSSASARTTPRLSSARLRLLTPTRARALKLSPLLWTRSFLSLSLCFRSLFLSRVWFALLSPPGVSAQGEQRCF